MDERQPWEQLPEENNRWYGRFVIYLEGGTERTLLGALNEMRRRAQMGVAKSLTAAWNKKQKEYRWIERAKAYDTYQRAIEEAQAVELRRKEQEEIVELRRVHRKNEMMLAEMLMGKVKELLEIPSRVDHNAAGTAARAVKQFSETARAALNMPVMRAQIDWRNVTTDDLLALYESLRTEKEE